MQATGANFQGRIDDGVLVLFSMVAEAAGWATQALLDQDTDRARVVIDDDKAFDARCEELTGLVKDRLAARNLEPSELEDLIAVLQIIPELERSADLAEHVAQRAVRSVGAVITPRGRGLIEQMSRVVIQMWRDAAMAYRHRSKDTSFHLKDADDELDALATDLVNEVIESHASPQAAVDLALLARFYERLGDHAVNLAARIEFMSTPRRGGPSRFLTSTTDISASVRKKRSLFHNLSRFRFAPRDDGFVQLFRAAAINCRDCSTTLRKLVGSLDETSELILEIKTYEERGDQLTVEVLSRLDSSFVTPFDREDIHALAEEFDDVVDAMFSAASLIGLTADNDPPPELAQLTDTLVAMADELVQLVSCLPAGDGSRRHLERIGHLERQGDAEFRHGIGKLLSGAYEPLAVIAWKDIVEEVEASLNSIEDVADVIEGILVKNS
jgi:predicted phosphate transport protein (TIGR00153 family)